MDIGYGKISNVLFHLIYKYSSKRRSGSIGAKRIKKFGLVNFEKQVFQVMEQFEHNIQHYLNEKAFREINHEQGMRN